jgi:hypothetical protein
MRKLGTLPLSYTIAVTVTYGLLLISMCYGILHALFTRFLGTASLRLLCLLALAFAAWTHHGTMRITCGNGFCDLAKGDSDTEAANRLLSASYAALGRRWIGRRLGWRTARRWEIAVSGRRGGKWWRWRVVIREEGRGVNERVGRRGNLAA